MALKPPNILCFFILVLMLLCSSIAQTQRNISLPSSLTASARNNPSWESPSGDFAFGFQQIGKDEFLLAIWFNNIPQRTIVWSANRNDPVQEGSKVELTSSGFVLNDPTGKQIWAFETAGTTVAYGAMLDTGNFVLADQDSANLWESFKEPTDTLLPTQNLVKGMKLVARYSEANYSSGRFYLGLDTDGNLQLYTVTLPFGIRNTAYWPEQNKTLGSGSKLTFNRSGFIYLEAQNGTILYSIPSNGDSTRNFYQRAILESDGVFRQYVYPRSNGQSSNLWNMSWSQSSTSIPLDICTSIVESRGSGACGFNSYCRLEADNRPKCHCPAGYTFIDPNEPMKGCKPSFETQSCDEGSQDADHFSLDTMESANWAGGDFEFYQSVTEDWCKKACLSDCFCALAIFNYDGGCWKKRSPFSNGMIDPNDDIGTKAFIKTRKDNLTSVSRGSTQSKWKDQSKMLLIGFLGGSVFLNLLLLVGSLVLFFFVRKGKVIQTQSYEVVPNINLRAFTYKELDKATYGFKEEIGRGSFGTVFKGILPSGDIAVKKLNSVMNEREQEFKSEISAIGRTNHKNLVQLIGFCNEGQDLLLVYEFMSNGSLASFLFGPLRPKWHHRMQLALQIARGLFYLHEECSTQIIHCDIKPQNILLDDSHTARISDFGLAKILKTDQTRTTTKIRGTKGYVAPEWFRNVGITVKVDVYSYGILLLELISCRKNFEAEAEDETRIVLADWAYDCYTCGKLYSLVENDDEALEDMKRVKRYVMAAIWCLQEDPSLRPTMKKVIQMLEGTIQVPIPPDPNSVISSL